MVFDVFTAAQPFLSALPKPGSFVLHVDHATFRYSDDEGEVLEISSGDVQRTYRWGIDNRFYAEGNLLLPLEDSAAIHTQERGRELLAWVRNRYLISAETVISAVLDAFLGKEREDRVQETVSAQLGTVKFYLFADHLASDWSLSVEVGSLARHYSGTLHILGGSWDEVRGDEFPGEPLGASRDPLSAVPLLLWLLANRHTAVVDE
jgi:hypothetical protein